MVTGALLSPFLPAAEAPGTYVTTESSMALAQDGESTVEIQLACGTWCKIGWAILGGAIWDGMKWTAEMIADANAAYCEAHEGDGAYHPQCIFEN